MEVITLRFDDELGSFDTGRLEALQEGNEILEYSDHFFLLDGLPHLALVISSRAEEGDRRKRRRSRKADPRSDLDAREVEIYDALRKWRAVRAKEEGVPPYLIMTNKQAAQMVRSDARCREDLAKLRGFGRARLDRYAGGILDLLARCRGDDPSEAAPGTGSQSHEAATEQRDRTSEGQSAVRKEDGDATPSE